MNNKHIKSVFVLCLLTLPLSAISGQSSTQFSFTINAESGTCDVSLPDTVDMGRIIRNQLMPAGKHSPQKSFDISLDNCTWVTGVRVTMEGNADENNPQYYAVTSSRGTTATGVALEITDDAGTIISPSQATDVYSQATEGAAAVLHFKADYVSVSDSPGAGDADATVTVKLEYQ